MSVVAEFTIRSSEFILGQILARGPEMRVEMERVVPASGRVMPYVWVTGDDFEAFERAVEASPYVESIAVLDRVADSALYRVEWDEDVESLIYGIAATNATILEARGDREWRFRIRFDDHGGLADFNDFCRTHDIVFQLERVYTLADEQEEGYVFDLTEAQRDALVAAVEAGYFEVPRRTTLGEIGETLGITQQSVSENVRRGADKVLKKVLVDGTASSVRRGD
jgi:hypothetical protein